MFTFSPFNRHPALQEVSQFLNSTLLIYETYLINITSSITKKTILRTPPFNTTLERISSFDTSISKS